MRGGGFGAELALHLVDRPASRFARFRHAHARALPVRAVRLADLSSGAVRPDRRGHGRSSDWRAPMQPDAADRRDAAGQHPRAARTDPGDRGVSGFVGANLFRTLAAVRSDVFGAPCAAARTGGWGLPATRSRVDLIDSPRPRPGRRSARRPSSTASPTAPTRSRRTPADLPDELPVIVNLIGAAGGARIAAFVHAGSSSEYGDNCSRAGRGRVCGPTATTPSRRWPPPTCSTYMGKTKGFPCANLRLYSVYGPLEDTSRLIPTLLRNGARRRAARRSSTRGPRATSSMSTTSSRRSSTRRSMQPGDLRRVFNIGTGKKTTIARTRRDGATTSSASTSSRSSAPWKAAPGTCRTGTPTRQGDRATRLEARDRACARGCERTADWYQAPARQAAHRRGDQEVPESTRGAACRAIVACYKDDQAIPIMYRAPERHLHEARHRLRDHLRQRLQPRRHRRGHPRDLSGTTVASSASRTRAISARRRRSAAAWSSRPRTPCVLLDGDLQDPPELIEQFVTHWRRRATTSSTAVASSARCPVHAGLLYKAVLPRLRALQLRHDPARRRRLLADRPARRRLAAATARSATCSCAACAPTSASSRPASTTSGPSGCSARRPTACSRTSAGRRRASSRSATRR